MIEDSFNILFSFRCPLRGHNGVYYEEKEQKQEGFDMRKKEDFLLFMFDENSNFGYAMQWFSIGFIIFALHAGRFRTDLKWKFWGPSSHWSEVEILTRMLYQSSRSNIISSSKESDYIY